MDDILEPITQLQEYTALMDYKSIVCQEDSYLKELVRYIHLNPVPAGMIADLKALNR